MVGCWVQNKAYVNIESDVVSPHVTWKKSQQGISGFFNRLLETERSLKIWGLQVVKIPIVGLTDSDTVALCGGEGSTYWATVS